MIKQIPSLARITAMVFFALSCFLLMLYFWILFGGPTAFKPKGYQFTSSFDQAGQLAAESDVRISGVTVGRVKTVAPSFGRTAAVIELEPRYAPLPSDAKAIIRQKSLVGESYVELTPGTRGHGVPPIPDGGRLANANVAATYRLDQLIKTFDKKTRAAFQDWLFSQAVAFKGRGGDLNQALGAFPIFVHEGGTLLDALHKEEPALRLLIRNAGTVFEAIDARPGMLTETIVNSNKIFAVTARRNQQLADTFREFPRFIEESKATTERFSSFIDNTTVFVDQTTEIARQLSLTTKTAANSSADVRSAAVNLNPLLGKADSGLPSFDEFLDLATPVLAQLDPFLSQLNPVLHWFGLYKREITSFAANFGMAAQAAPDLSSAKVSKHVLRGFATMSPEMLPYSASRFDRTRGNAYFAPGAYDRLAAGLQVFDAVGCAGISIPPLNPDLSTYTESMKAVIPYIYQFVYSGDATGPPATGVPAPACSAQAPFSYGGEVTDYPHVRAQLSP